MVPEELFEIHCGEQVAVQNEEVVRQTGDPAERAGGSQGFLLLYPGKDYALLLQGMVVK